MASRMAVIMYSTLSADKLAAADREIEHAGVATWRCHP